MAEQTIIGKPGQTLVVNGNLEVTGSQISTSTTDTEIKDRIITVNKGGTLTGTQVSGIEVESGGGIVATLGYNTDGTGGWDFGGANIINAGAISTSLINLSDTPANYTGTAGQYLRVNSGETAVEFDTLTTDDVAEGADLYYTDARADARINLQTGANLDLSQRNTDNLPEGSTNRYFSNTLADARIAVANIGDLANVHNTVATDGQVLKWDNANSRWAPAADTDTVYTSFNTDFDTRFPTKSITGFDDVDTVTASNDGQILYYDHGTTSFKWQSPAVAVANYSIDKVSSLTLNSIGDSYSSGGTIVTKTLTGIDSSSKIQLSFTVDIGAINPAATGNKFAVFKAVSGDTMSYSGNFAGAGNPGMIYEGQTTGYSYNVFTFTIGDETSMGNGAVEYQVVFASQSGLTTTSINLTDTDFSATEFRTNLIDELNELSDVNTSGATSGQILKYNGASWTPVDNNLNGIDNVTITAPASNQILRYNGSVWINGDLSPFNIGDLGNVDTTGAANNKILKYNGTTWVVADDNYEDGIVDVVEDTTPQLGGDLDVQTHSIISTGANNIVLNPQGTGTVEILGDLTVTGTATTLEVTNVEVEDAIMLLNKHDTQPANNTNDGGVMVQRGTAEDNAAWFWDETDNRWIAATTVSNASATDIAVTANADIQAATAYLTATEAQYADLAEIYESDADYEPGTVLVIGGDKEVTQCKILQDPRVVGVVSTAPAYLMNKDANGVAVALRGKVPCKVEGPVRKGDLLVTNVTPGTATTLTDDSPTPPAFCVIGKSLETDESTGIKLINIIV
jgi:hypothetical protein